MNEIGPIRPRAMTGVPEHLMYSSQMDLQYILYDDIQPFGDCYCEVGNGSQRIDLVWQQKCDGTRQVIGLEIKDHINTLAQVKQQLEEYKDWKLSEFVEGTPVTESGEVAGQETLFFDDIWLVTIGNESLTKYDWTSGQLHYNRSRETLEYNITEKSQASGNRSKGECLIRNSPSGIAVDFDLGEFTAEHHLTAQIARYYRKRGNWISAEVPTTTPRNRQIVDGTVKRPRSRSQIDLIVVDHEALPITIDTQIHGIEVKRQFNSQIRNRLHNQLTTYLDSGIYSHVWLAVPYEYAAKAYEFCEENGFEAGVLALRGNGGVDQKRSPERQSFERVPVIKKKRGEYKTYFWEP